MLWISTKEYILTANSANRFTKIVKYYALYRPDYPNEVLNLLKVKCGLTPATVIADVGSGTGILTRQLLDLGNKVFGVEPNDSMRIQAEKFLTNYSKFISVKGTAEATTLPAQSIDLITVGTAFHWFDPEKTKREFQRILVDNRWVVLIFNVRDVAASDLVKDYEALLLTYSHDYKNSAAQKFDNSVTTNFFQPHQMLTGSFNHQQNLNWEAFKGRLLSTSYCPNVNDPHYPEMLAELKRIFNLHQVGGSVAFKYLTKVYYGRI